MPLLQRTLIHDNGASVKNKGIHFALKRMKTQLRRHYRKYGKTGYIMLIDFKNYFGNIRHDIMLDIYKKAFGEDRRLMWLAELFVKAFGDVGLGLGSEVSQGSAIAYLTAIDHFIKERLRLVYAHYMDDNEFLLLERVDAINNLRILTAKYDEYGIVTTPKKINIVKLSQGFTFIKARFSITDTGRIVLRSSRESITRQRRKLKKFKVKHDAGQMTLDDIHCGYMSWRGYIAHFKAGKTIKNMDYLYQKLFGVSPIQKT